MAQQQEYEALCEVLVAMPVVMVHAPRRSVSAVTARAEEIYHDAVQDRDALQAAALDWSIVESLPQRTGALE